LKLFSLSNLQNDNLGHRIKECQSIYSPFPNLTP